MFMNLKMFGLTLCGLVPFSPKLYLGQIWGVIGFLSLSCSHTSETPKTPVQEMINDEAQYADWMKRSTSVDWQDLIKVHEVTQRYRQDYPQSAHARYISAVMAGDYSELLSAEEEAAIKSTAAKDLFALMEQLGKYPERMQKIIRNEYYYHSNQFLQQYLLGCEELSSGNASSGHFSIGVGGSEHAFFLLKKGQIREARYFAERAVKSWEQHALATPKWPYPYPYFYIQALAIAGQKTKAREVLSRIKSEPAYKLKKPIYDKYERRGAEIEKAIPQ